MATTADSYSRHHQHPINCLVVGEVSRIEGGEVSSGEISALEVSTTGRTEG